eukprot:g454.t1 g454   contig10:70658-72573(+)
MTPTASKSLQRLAIVAAFILLSYLPNINGYAQLLHLQHRRGAGSSGSSRTYSSSPPSSSSSFVPVTSSSIHNSLPTTTSARTKSTLLSMHMGHSHSHHHHHDHSSSNKNNNTPFSPTNKRLITLVPRLLKCIQHRSLLKISKRDIAAFVLLSGILAISDSIRDEAKAVIDKGQSWRLSMVKHSTPLSADYFFRNDNAADRVTFLGVIINLVLSSGKAVVGVMCHSSALIADAGHSLSDLFSDFVTLWAVQVARLPPDEDHPYGHGKFESVGSLFLSLTLLGTGLSVGLSSYKKFLEVITVQRVQGIAAAAKLVEVPTWPALVVAGLSILSKEWLYRITRRVGEKLNSQVVIANAWHHRSDAYSSVLALISIGLAMSVPGFLAADPAAGMLVAGMIAMTGAEIMGESMKQLTDAVTDEEMIKSVESVASEDADVKDVVRVRARQVGSKALVDVEVSTPQDFSASAMKAIEERIRVRVLSDVSGVLDVEVRATAEDVVFCPLLTAMDDSDLEHQISATQVEGKAREVLEAHPDVKSVEAVTVHYQDTVLVRVDANIILNDSSCTVSEANGIAKALRKKLEESEDNNIDQANIFLDLNADMSSEENSSRERVLSP